jgi:hypothetical protein
MRAVALRSSATDRTLTSALVPEYDNGRWLRKLPRNNRTAF